MARKTGGLWTRSVLGLAVDLPWGGHSWQSSIDSCSNDAKYYSRSCSASDAESRATVS